MRSESPYRAVKAPDGIYDILSATGDYCVRAKVSKKLAEQLAAAMTKAHELGMAEVAADITESRIKQQQDRAFAPHCDQTILHAPGKCEHCDKYPDWQAYRQVAQIAFSGDPDERGRKQVLPEDRGSMTRLEDYEPGIAPCPSTWFRDPAVRDRWFGNRPDAGSAEGGVMELGDQLQVDASPICWLCTRPIASAADLAYDGRHPVHRQCHVAVPDPKPSLLRRLLRGGR